MGRRPDRLRAASPVRGRRPRQWAGEAERPRDACGAVGLRGADHDSPCRHGRTSGHRPRGAPSGAWRNSHAAGARLPPPGRRERTSAQAGDRETGLQASRPPTLLHACRAPLKGCSPRRVVAPNPRRGRHRARQCSSFSPLFPARRRDSL